MRITLLAKNSYVFALLGGCLIGAACSNSSSVSTNANSSMPAGMGSVASAAPTDELDECETPSVDRIQRWVATLGEGDMVPAGGSIIVKEGDDYVGRIVFNGYDWHVVPMYPSNDQRVPVDFTNSKGFYLTYSATNDFFVQMRPAHHWSGGTQYGTRIPSTNGEKMTRFFSFAKENWGKIPGLSVPTTWTYEETLQQVRGLVWVGNMPNGLVFYGIRFDNYVPPCQPAPLSPTSR